MQEQTDKVSWWKHRWWWKTPALAMLALLLCYIGWIAQAYYQVNQRLTQMRARGEPTNLAELDAWYPHPKGPNGADAYVKAFELFDRDAELETKLPGMSSVTVPFKHNEPVSEEMAQLITGYLDRNAAALAAMHEAGKFQEFRYPLDFNTADPLQSLLLLPHLPELRHGTRLFALQSVMQLEQGQTDQAIQSVRDILRLAISLDHEPALISIIVRNDTARLAIDAADRILTQSSLNDAQLQELWIMFADAHFKQSVQRALVGERTMYLSLLRGESGTDPTIDENLNFFRVTGLMVPNQLVYLKMMDAAMNDVQHPQSAKSFEVSYDNLPAYALPARVLAPPHPAIMVNIDLSLQAHLRVLQAAIATKRYQLANDRLPDALGDLVPAFLDEVPIDPFDRQPLRYIRDGNEPRIYSIGKNRRDNHGTYDLKSTANFDDLIVHVGQ